MALVESMRISTVIIGLVLSITGFVETISYPSLGTCPILGFMTAIKICDDFVKKSRLSDAHTAVS